MNIIHYIDSLSVGGAQSLMYELHDAIKNNYPGYKQYICAPPNAPINKDFKLTWNVKINLQEFINIPNVFIKKNKLNKCIVIVHKVLKTDTRKFNSIYSKIPIIMINHTLPGSTTCRGKVDAIVSVSKHMYKKISALNTGARNEFIRNGVGYKKYESILARENIYGNKYLLTGRINRIAGIKYSPRWLSWCSFVKLKKRMVHEYIGRGESYKKAVDLVKKFQKVGAKKIINKVVIMGSIDNFEKKISVLKSWDLFLYSVMHNEGTSMSILESLACGVPVVCSAHYGNMELISNGVNGYIFKNYLEATSILNKLSGNPERLKELKKTTKRHFIRNLDSSIMAGEYIKLIESVYSSREAKSV